MSMVSAIGVFAISLVLFTVHYGKGRGFNTTLGYVDGRLTGGLPTIAMESVGFIVTLQRGCEWAARALHE